MSLHPVAGLVIGHNRGGEHIEQFFGALGAAAYGFYDRHAQRIFHLAAVNLNTAALCIVHHVEVDKQGNPLLHELNRQEQIAFEVGAVHHVHHEVKFRVHEIIDNDFFFR